MTQILNVDLGNRSYPIHIGAGLLTNAGELLREYLPMPELCIITDENVAALHLATLTASLEKSNIAYHTVVVPAGEKSKTFERLINVLDSIFETRPERNTTLVALGGGVVGDLTGFAASILLRGVNFIQIPTTLLSQVDSSVGGKTGINNRFGKNLIGSFYQPRQVLIDIDMLSTLPKREFLSGYAEVVKYGLIGDKPFFEWLENNKANLLALDHDTLIYAIEKCCHMKAHVVANDEKEKGQRALLNLGHTFAHAFEEATGYSDTLLHGEAVAIGMVAAFAMSERLGYCPKGQTEILKDHLVAMGLATNPLDIQPDWDIETLLNTMAHDKKVSHGKLVFVLARGIGEAFVEKNIDRTVVYDTLHSLINQMHS